MPYLALKISRPLPATAARQLAGSLTGLTVALLGKKREVTAVAIETASPGHWFVGGNEVDPCPGTAFHLEILITEGTNTEQEKADFIAAAWSALETALGPLATASYCVIRDHDGRAWGYGGITQTARRRAAAGASL
jgi:4-oxalocrotonate tautomerase